MPRNFLEGVSFTLTIRSERGHSRQKAGAFVDNLVESEVTKISLNASSAITWRDPASCAIKDRRALMINRVSLCLPASSHVLHVPDAFENARLTRNKGRISFSSSGLCCRTKQANPRTKQQSSVGQSASSGFSKQNASPHADFFAMTWLGWGAFKS